MRLFEIGRRYLADGEYPTLACVLAGERAERSWQGGKAQPFDAFDAKALCLGLLEAAGAPVDKLQVMGEAGPVYHPGLSATLRLGPSNPIASFGMIHPSTLKAFDIESESPETIDRYGRTVNAMSLLAARRLVEIGVPFITVFWSEEDEAVSKKCLSGGGWDTHGNNFRCLKEDLLPEFDRCFSALIEDLSARALLDTTMLMVTSEMGRKPKIGDPRSGGAGGAGRDHWTACQSVLLAGGGIRGGQTFGTTDKRAEYLDQNPVAPEHIARTVFHAMGIDDLHAIDREGRPFHLMEDGRALAELF